MCIMGVILGLLVSILDPPVKVNLKYQNPRHGCVLAGCNHVECAMQDAQSIWKVVDAHFSNTSYNSAVNSVKDPEFLENELRKLLKCGQLMKVRRFNLQGHVAFS